MPPYAESSEVKWYTGTASAIFLFQGVEVKAGSIIKESVIMPNAVIGKNVFIERAIVPSDMHIPDGTVIRDDENGGEIILVTEEMIKEIHS